MGEFSVLTDVLLAIVGGLIGGLMMLWGLTRSEAFRRLARWEPYAEALWNRRMDVAGDLVGRSARSLFLKIQIASSKNMAETDQLLTELRETAKPFLVVGPPKLLFGEALNKAILDHGWSILGADDRTTKSEIDISQLQGTDSGAHNERLNRCFREHHELVGLFRKELDLSAIHKLATDAFREVAERLVRQS